MKEEAKAIIKKYHDKHVSPAGITSLLQQAGLHEGMGNYQSVKKQVEREINVINEAALMQQKEIEMEGQIITVTIKEGKRVVSKSITGLELSLYKGHSLLDDIYNALSKKMKEPIEAIERGKR